MTYYEDITAWYAKARSKAQGRPLGTWGRVIRQGREYKFYAQQGYNPAPFGLLTPDNVFTFLYTGMQVSRVSNTLAISLNNYTPFSVQRIAKHRYNVVHDLEVPDDTMHGHWDYPKVFGWEMFPGIRFDMATGRCLNPKDPVVRVVDPDARRVWLRALRKFKHQMRTRAKLGVFDSYVAQVLSTKDNSMPDWTSDEWLDVLYKAMRDEQYGEVLMRGLACHSIRRAWHRTSITYEHVVDAVNDVCTVTSLDLRRRFGVFEER